MYDDKKKLLHIPDKAGASPVSFDQNTLSTMSKWARDWIHLSLWGEQSLSEPLIQCAYGDVGMKLSNLWSRKDGSAIDRN